MLRALPVLIILGLAIYSFFDVLKTEELLIRRGPKTMWMILALIPVIGAALWFMFGRPVRDREAYPPPRAIILKHKKQQVAPDDDVSFLRKLEQEAWLRKRDEARAKERGETDEPESAPEPTPPATGKDSAMPDEDESVEGSEPQPKAKEKSADEQDL